MAQIETYPELVDTVWGTVQKMPRFTYKEVASELGIPVSPSESNPSFHYGIRQAINDLIDLKYCEAQKDLRLIWPSPNAPSNLPSQRGVIQSSLYNLSTLQARLLQFIHQKTICKEDGIAFYNQSVGVSLDEASKVLLPIAPNAYSAGEEIHQALLNLQKHHLIKAVVPANGYDMWVTFLGACWLASHPIAPIVIS